MMQFQCLYYNFETGLYSLGFDFMFYTGSGKLYSQPTKIY